MQGVRHKREYHKGRHEELSHDTTEAKRLRLLVLGHINRSPVSMLMLGQKVPALLVKLVTFDLERNLTGAR